MPEQPNVNPQPLVNPWIVAIAVMFGTFMEVLDTTVVNVSLEHIAGDLSSTIEEATWGLTSYLVANAIVLPITGWLASYFGRKRLLMMSIVGFTAASFLCGFAPTLGFLVICRIIQGAAGGCLQPLSQAILLEAFPPDQRGKAMGFWGLGIVVAPVLGPVLGGWLTDSYSWRWVFYINIPVGIASLVMANLFVFDPAYLKRARNKIDFWGIGFLSIWIGALQIALDKGEQDDWFSSRFVVALIGVSYPVLRHVHRARIYRRTSGRRPARIQTADLFCRCGPHDGRGFRVVWQPRAAAHLDSDAARVSRAAGRYCTRARGWAPCWACR